MHLLTERASASFVRLSSDTAVLTRLRTPRADPCVDATLLQSGAAGNRFQVNLGEYLTSHLERQKTVAGEILKDGFILTVVSMD